MVPKKKFLLIILLFIIGLGLIIYAEEKTNTYKKVLSEKEALLILDYGNGKQRWFAGETKEGMTILDVLTASAFAGHFNFTANSHLTDIDGLGNNQEKQWSCYLNERKIKEDLKKVIIKPNDKILCRYK